MTFGQNVGLVDVIVFDFEDIVYRGMRLVAPPRLDLERDDCPIFPLSDQIELAYALLCEVAQGKPYVWSSCSAWECATLHYTGELHPVNPALV